MTPVELSRTVLRAMRRAADDGELGELRAEGLPERVVVERPRPGGCGDYATNVALQLARPAGRAPRHVAETLSCRLAAEPGIAAVDITGPGFLNITLEGDPGRRAAAVVRSVRERGSRYGHVQTDTGQLVQLHTPHDLRALVLADSLRRILRSQGALVRVTCERPPEPAWTTVLGVAVDGCGTPPVELPTLRPVPAPGDPLPLGRDAGRWALLRPAAHDRPSLGQEHLAQRESNPLFRVQYAHARTHALLRNAADLGFRPEAGAQDAYEGAHEDAHEVAHEDAYKDAYKDAYGDEGAQRDLLDALADHPRVLAAAARHRAPDRLARHLVTAADALLAVQHTVLPMGGQKPEAAHRARLALAEAAGTVLAGGLSLLGISAPDHV